MQLQHLFKYIYKLYLLLLVFILGNTSIQAQTYPVQVSTFLTPPHPVYMSDYTSYSDKVQVQLLLTDLGTERDVYLQLSFSGQNGESVSSVGSQSAIHLVGGVPTVMTMTDLHDYFSSLTGAYQYNSPTALAEGVYFICFKVYDQQTNALISKSGCAHMLIAQNDPPFLVLPVNRDRIMEDASTANGMLQFQWTPRHIAQGIYQYKFKLARVQDTTISVQQYLTTYGPDYAVNDVNTPLHILNSTTYPLIPGSTYVWQVQVYQLIGTDTVVNFKNDGNSEIWWFKYDTAGCTTPSAPAVIDIFKTSLKIVANGASKIKYKKLDNINWIEAPVPDNTDTMLLSNLVANTQYEIRSGSVCSEGYIYSSSTTATTLSDTSTTHELTCVIEADNQITNQTRTATLVANNTFMAGKYKIYIDTITYNTGNSSFTGNGHVQVPYVYFANLKVKFENIGINTDNRLIDGQVITTWDPTMGNIADLNDIFGGGGHTGDVKTGDCKAESEVDFEITDASNITTSNITTSNITTDEDGIKTGDITISSGSKTATFSRIKLPTSIVDSKGTYYQVDENGNPKKIAETLTLTKDQLAQLKKISPTKQQPSSIFSAITGVTKYALDNYRTDYAYSLLWNAKYFNDEYPNYAITAKCMLPGKPDQIKVSLPNTWSAEDLKSVKFISTKGVKFVGEQVTKGSSDFTLNLLGGPADDAQLVMVAIEKGGFYETVAIIQLASYEQKTIKVAVVPVGSAALPSGITAANLQTELNNIYSKVAISFKVELKQTYVTNLYESGINVDETGAFTTLTSDMKNLINSYSLLNKTQDGQAIIFWMPELLQTAPATGNVEGYMPRGSNVGFINGKLFSNSTKQVIGRIISHELGHGVFKQHHPFHNDIGFSKGLIQDNLLEYYNGVNLSRYQWDGIHDPTILLNIFKDKQDYKSVAVGIESLNLLKNPPVTDATIGTNISTYTFITPSGKYITFIEDEISSVEFSTLDKTTYVISNELSKTIIPIGTLESFILKGGARYSYRGKGEMFDGYLDNKYQSLEKDYEPYLYKESKKISSIVKPTKGILGFLVIKEGVTSFYDNKFIVKASMYNSPNNSAASDAEDPNRIGFGGKLYEGFEILNIAESERASNFQALLQSKRIGSTTQDVTLDNNNISFSNENINLPVFLYEKPKSLYEMPSGEIKNIQTRKFLLLALKESSTFNDYLFYFNFVNLKPELLKTIGSCAANNTIPYYLINICSNCTTNYKPTAINKNLSTQTYRYIMENVDPATQSIEALIKSNSSMSLIIDEISKYELTCLFTKLSIESKLYILKHVFDNGLWCNKWFTNNNELYLNHLIRENYNLKDKKAIIDELKNSDYLLLRNIWDKHTSQVNGLSCPFEDTRDVLYAILDIMKDDYKNLDIKPTSENFYIDMNFGTPFSYNPGIEEVIYLDVPLNTELILKGASQKITVSNYNLTYTTNNKIEFKQQYSTTNTNTVIYQTGSTYSRQYSTNYSHIYNPFELVHCRVYNGTDANGFALFEDIYVPAFIACSIQNEYNRNKKKEELIKSASTASLAIIGAIFLQPELLAADATMATIFIANMPKVLAAAELARLSLITVSSPDAVVSDEIQKINELYDLAYSASFAFGLMQAATVTVDYLAYRSLTFVNTIRFMKRAKELESLMMSFQNKGYAPTRKLIEDLYKLIARKEVNVSGNVFKPLDILLTQFNSIIGNKGLKHLFRGEINSSGVASGVHHISAIRAGTAKIVPNTIDNLGNGFYKASVEVSDGAGGWIAKAEKSTFFPDAWDEVKVMQEIQSAASNRIGVFIENTTSYQKYFGISSNGNKIYIVRTPTYNNNIFTAWFEPL